MANLYGVICIGKVATVVITTGDVMDHRTQVTGVIVDGVPQPLESRHTRLWEQFRERK